MKYQEHKPMKIDNGVETRESWTPLEAALSRQQCVDFLWVGSAGTKQLYRHMDTRRYLMIDAATGIFYDEQNHALSKEAAINYVLSC
jgi:hypothetical protein